MRGFHGNNERGGRVVWRFRGRRLNDRSDGNSGSLLVGTISGVGEIAADLRATRRRLRSHGCSRSVPGAFRFPEPPICIDSIKTSVLTGDACPRMA